MKYVKLKFTHGDSCHHIEGPGVFCASRKYRELQRKVQRLAARFLNSNFSVSRRQRIA